MSLKKVTRILPAEKIDMGGFPVKQALPTNQVSQVDPFLLLHHARVKPIYDRPAKTQGVGSACLTGNPPISIFSAGNIRVTFFKLMTLIFLYEIKLKDYLSIKLRINRNYLPW